MPQGVKHNLVAGGGYAFIELGIAENHAEAGAYLVMRRIPRAGLWKDKTARLPLCFGLMLCKHVLHLFGHVDDAVHGVLGIHNRDCSVREVDVLPAQIEHFPYPEVQGQP